MLGGIPPTRTSSRCVSAATSPVRWSDSDDRLTTMDRTGSSVTGSRRSCQGKDGCAGNVPRARGNQTDGRMDATSRSATCSVQGRPARGSNFEPGEQRQCQRFSASLTDGGAAHRQCDGSLLRCARQAAPRSRCAVLSRFETAAGLVDRSNADSSAVTPSLTDYVVRRAPSLRRYYQRASSS
jgi:hypothetical protein